MLTLTRNNTTEGLVLVQDSTVSRLYNANAKVRGVFLTSNSIEIRIDEDVYEVATFAQLTINGAVQTGLSVAVVASGLSILFFKGSAGGGATPNLQAVNTVGNTTTLGMYLNQNAAANESIMVNGNPAIDPRAAKIGSNDIEDSGFLELNHKDTTAAQIIYVGGGFGGEKYSLPSKGANDTIAMLSDVPAFDANVYVATFSNLSANIASVTLTVSHYLKIGSFVTVWFQVSAAVSTVLANHQFAMVLPFAASSSTRITGSATSSNTGAALLNQFIPVTVTGLDTTHAYFLFYAPVAGSRQINGSFSYTI